MQGRIHLAIVLMVAERFIEELQSSQQFVRMQGRIHLATVLMIAERFWEELQNSVKQFVRVHAIVVMMLFRIAGILEHMLHRTHSVSATGSLCVYR
jgi:hypothetical protein